VSGRRIGVRNPRNGAVDHAIVALDAGAMARRAALLRRAQPDWAALTPDARAGHLEALAEALSRHRGAITAALETDTGRRRVAAMEVDGVIGLIRRWAARAPALLAELAEPRATAMPGVTATTIPDPYALVGVIAPWNFPMLLTMTDAVPALAAGSAVLAKPSEVAPRFVEPLLAAVAEVPAIAAVLALVTGDGATGAALVDQVDFVAFTGSVRTGRRVAEAATARFIPASVELGGKDALIVLEGADPGHAAAIALSGSCRATGQACQSIERILVARPLFEPFVAALVDAAARVRPNHPDIGAGDIGPFIFADQAAVAAAHVADARARGAAVLCGGTVLDLDGGLWMLPTVVTGVTPEMAIWAEESFAPLMPVMPFGTEDEAVELANDSPYGLSAAVVGPTLADAARVGARLNAGAVSLNDAALTSLVPDAEKSAYGLSGLGPSRMGDSGLLRFVRRRVLLAQAGTPLPLAAFSETGGAA
jgi:acyl-CoA reductase-like NAD-dependent aldehyde dehydrogenase